MIAKKPSTYDKMGVAYLDEDFTLVLPTYCVRPDLVAKYSEDVNRWLRAMTDSDEDFNRFMCWLANSLDVERKICGLALIGASNAGKSLLVQGLAECFTKQGRVISPDNLMGDYEQQIDLTAVVNAEEGWDLNTYDIKKLPSSFRKWIDGNVGSINPKGRALIHVVNNVRVIMTANNDGIITQVMDLKHTNSEDRTAIATRIMRIKVPRSASNYMSKNGNISREQKWVNTDFGERGNQTLARHIVWLFENRHLFKKYEGERFLVDGNLDGRHASRLFANSEENYAVMYALEAVLQERKNSNARKKVLYIEEGELRDVDNPYYSRNNFNIYVNSRQLYEFFARHEGLQKSANNIKIAQRVFERSLKNICKSSKSVRIHTESGNYFKGFQLDPFAVAESYDITSCDNGILENFINYHEAIISENFSPEETIDIADEYMGDRTKYMDQVI